MSTITKELAKLFRKITNSEIDAEGNAHVVLSPADSLLINNARIALASLEAEPVGEVSEQRDGLVMDGMVDLGGASTHRIIKGASKMKRLPLGTKFYTAPPAPVSVPAAMEMDDDFDSAFEHGKAVGWNAYRAAMLQGADGKPELTVWYGAMPETNGKTNWTAILHRKGECISTGITIDRSEYPERVRYEADRIRHLIGELADEPDILSYDADAHSGYVEPVTTAYKLRDAVETIRNSGIAVDAEKIQAERDILNTPDCWCRTCRPVKLNDMRFVVCPDCGNKRCPHANDHRNTCTGSNEPGQEGSAYPAAPKHGVN